MHARNLTALAGCLLLVTAVALADPVAAGVVAAGLLAIALMLRQRSRTRLRLGAALAVLGITVSGAAAALAVPTFQQRPTPLIIPVGSSDASAQSDHPPTGFGAVSSAGNASTFEALGFVATDDDNATTAVDQNVAAVTTLAATGLTLSASAGSLLAAPVGDVIQRAHLNGAQGLITVSNYGDHDFDGRRVARALNDGRARQRLVSALSGYIARGGWDGVVLDFELLPGSVRRTYPQFVRELHAALGRSRVMIALPAFTSLTDPDSAAFDVPALTQAADSITLMAYDDHEASVGPGDIAGLPWVRKVTRELVDQVGQASLGKFLLGVPAYGYLWSSSGANRELTVAQARALAGQRGAVDRFDPVQGERHLTLADGSQAWYDDRVSVARHVALARQLGFAGIADWHLGGGDNLDASQLGPIRKYPIQRVPGRTIERVDKAGLVALTFDDGPDPTWTPKILQVLARMHVPATFFVIGTDAQRHPALLRQELNQGHVVGSHTYDHQDLSDLMGWHAAAEIIGGAAVIEGITGRKPLLFRSPYGSGDLSGAGSSNKDDLSGSLGFHAVNWTADTLDWRRPSVAAIVDAADAQKSARTTVLMHDGGGDRSQTLAALPLLIERLRSEGYQFTTVDAFDGSIASPYATRSGWFARARGVAIIAAWRLDMASRQLLLALLIIIAAVSGWRLLVAVPLAGWHAVRHRRTRPLVGSDGQLPTVSVLVPAHNEERVLASCLASLQALSPAPHEIIVINDGSVDATSEVAHRFPVHLLEQTKQGKAAALNAGLTMASGEVVVVLDADTQLAPDFLAATAGHFADPRVGAVAGNVKVGNTQRLLARLQSLEYVVSLNLDRRAQAVLNSISVVPGAAGAFRRSALLELGGYPRRTLVEDADLTMMLLRAGWTIPYEARAIALTEAPQNVADVLRQRRRWSFGTVQVFAAHREALLSRHGGRPGWLALPWLLLSQIVTPMLGPIVDLYLLYLLIAGQGLRAVVMLALALSVDLVVCGAALAMDREPLSRLWLVPALRLVWRPLQLWASMRSSLTWVAGGTLLWRRITRHNTVRPSLLRPLEAAVQR